MKLLFAPDSFKGSLSAKEICRIMAQAAQDELDCETVSVPIADGGEGTAEALVTAGGGAMEAFRVTGPCYDKVEAAFGLIRNGQTAVIEMAQASGLPMVPANRRDPARTTSRGTGELMRHALDLGVRDMIIGIGGCATNDGGMGVLHALGARFYDDRGDIVPDCGWGLEQVRRIDLGGLDVRLQNTSIRVVCDVTNPLLGPQGATYVYGPQKGGQGMALQALEAGMIHYAQRFREKGIDIADFPGAGAAGGLGGVLKGVLNASLLRGVDAVLDAVAFDSLLAGVDLVFTGEGRLDGQSVRFGKVPSGVAKRCLRKEIPVVALVGGMGEGAEDFLKLGNTSVMALTDGPMPLEKSMADAARLLYSAMVRALRLVQMGEKISRSQGKA